MDYKRLALAAVVAWFVDSMYGLVVWMTMMGDQFARYPAIFRPEAAMTAYVPLMFAGSLLSMFVLAYIYAKGYENGNGVLEGIRFGALLGLFIVSFVAVGIYGSVNIGRRIAVIGSGHLFLEMILVGAVIGLMYRPLARPKAAGGTAV